MSPNPMSTPATKGTAQWILAVKPVQPNLELGRIRVSSHARATQPAGSGELGNSPEDADCKCRCP